MDNIVTISMGCTSELCSVLIQFMLSLNHLNVLQKLYYDSMLKWKVTGIQKGMEMEQQAVNLMESKY